MPLAGCIGNFTSAYCIIPISHGSIHADMEDQAFAKKCDHRSSEALIVQCRFLRVFFQLPTVMRVVCIYNQALGQSWSVTL